MLLDLDGFKDVNDEHGDAAGDRLLKAAASHWREALRDTDYLGRIGGDEFAIALPGCRSGQQRLIVERLREAMPSEIGVSIGVAMWDGTESEDSLRTRADEALYADKRTRAATR